MSCCLLSPHSASIQPYSVCLWLADLSCSSLLTFNQEIALVSISLSVCGVCVCVCVFVFVNVWIS